MQRRTVSASSMPQVPGRVASSDQRPTGGERAARRVSRTDAPPPVATRPGETHGSTCGQGGCGHRRRVGDRAGHGRPAGPRPGWPWPWSTSTGRRPSGWPPVLGGLGLQADVGPLRGVAGHRRSGDRALRRHRSRPPQRRGDHRRGRHHQGHRRHLPPGRRGQRGRGLLRRPGPGPRPRARGGGAIVATASLAGLIGFSPDPIYCLTKHAVVGLVRSLGPQLAEHGHHHQRRVPEHRGHPADRRHPRRAGRRAGSPSSTCRRWHETVVDRALGSGDRRGHGHPGRSGGSGLPVRPTSRAAGRRNRGADATDRAGRPRSGLSRSAAVLEPAAAADPVSAGQPTRPTPAKSPPVRTPVLCTVSPVSGLRSSRRPRCTWPRAREPPGP